MATIINNDLTLGLRGRVGKFMVFRTFGGKAFASHSPRKPDKTKETELQRTTRCNFRTASKWAVRILLDPERKAYYKKRADKLDLPNAYTAAVSDYMRGNVELETQLRTVDTSIFSKLNLERHVLILLFKRVG